MARLAKAKEIASNAEADTLSEAVVKCAESGPAKENERGSIVCYVLLDSVCFYRSRGREKATQS